MKLAEALENVWKAINKIENIDFDQTGENIKDDLLGIHRQFYQQDGVMDEVTDRLQELQTVVDEYQSIADELGIDLITYFEIIAATHIVTKQGKCNVYKIETRRKAKELCVVLSGKWIGHPEIHNELILPFSLFGKTWALTEEGLEG